MKIDVGLSSNAPQSEIWLQEDPELIVFGFEPVSRNVSDINNGKSIWPIRLLTSRLNTSFHLLPCAIVDSGSQWIEMYVTENDPGCSSIYKPINMAVSSTELAPAFPLYEFLEFFPFDQIPHIDHLKIDTQGSDYEVLKSARSRLRKVCFVTVEIDTVNYEKSKNSRKKIYLYLLFKGFIPTDFFLTKALLRFVLSGVNIQTDDPTFLNILLLRKITSRKFYIYQSG